MIEIAISLAIIGIALVAIVGVLPIGMRTQQDNRQETIINQDATILMEDIRNGVKGADDLTNYVYAITNTWTEYRQSSPNPLRTGSFGYTYSGFVPHPAAVPSIYSQQFINSGTNIIGLLSTPEYQDINGKPIPNLNIPDLINGLGYSNHVVAYVYSMSGPAVEKPPQPSDSLVRQSAFAYRLICVNVPVPFSPPGLSPSSTNWDNNFQNNLYELRLFFLWPQQPSGTLGPGRQSFRTMIAGRMVPDGIQTNLLFFQSQSFNDSVVAGGPP